MANPSCGAGSRCQRRSTPARSARRAQVAGGRSGSCVPKSSVIFSSSPYKFCAWSLAVSLPISSTSGSAELQLARPVRRRRYARRQPGVVRSRVHCVRGVQPVEQGEAVAPRFRGDFASCRAWKRDREWDSRRHESSCPDRRGGQKAGAPVGWPIRREAASIRQHDEGWQVRRSGRPRPY